MSTYVIAHNQRDFLDTPVFHAGSDGQQEAIAIFTRPDLAKKYIDDADWADEYNVGTLEPIQLLRWFTIAHEEGCDLVAIDPLFSASQHNKPQQVLDLSEPLLAFAESLRVKLSKAAEEGSLATGG